MSASEGADGEQWADDLSDSWDDVDHDPPQAAPDPPDVEASTTGSQVLLRQRGT